MSGIYSPDEIVPLLRSITKVGRNANGKLEVWFDWHTSEPFLVSGFNKQSFIGELMKLIDVYVEKSE
jgi:hypothetical protein